MFKYYEEFSREQLIDAFVGQYLTTEGWLASIDQRESLDNAGPVPWITYPALKVLEQIVKPHYSVFEYGCGNSTLWWYSHASEIVTVEHDPEWYAEMVKRIGTNNRLIHVPIDAPLDTDTAASVMPFFEADLAPPPGPDPLQNLRAGRLNEPFKAYAAELLRYPPEHFDVIVIDGMARVLTAWLAAQRVKQTGFIIFDNSDRDFYQAGYDILTDAGFYRIDFWGPGPINPYGWCTSIFTRSLKIFEH